jgi:hypothetical protein
MKASSSVRLIISYEKSFSEDMVKSFNGMPIEKTWLSCNDLSPRNGILQEIALTLKYISIFVGGKI